MNRFLGGVALASLMGCGTAPYKVPHTARVLSSVPVVQPVSAAHQVCGGERLVAQPSRNTGVGATFGAVAGGVAGNAVGSGDGRALATLFGAVLGALWGERAEARQAPDLVSVRDCAWVQVQEERVVGYDVRYEYAGRHHQARLAQDPGATITVEAVAP